LGGKKKGNVYFNLLIVFFVTGLWHGASWNFVVWGLWHGLFLIVERIVNEKGIKLKIPSSIKWLYTMIVVLIGWVLFRAPDLKYAIDYLGVMFGIVQPEKVGFSVFWYLNSKIITVIVIGILASANWKSIFSEYFKKIENKVFYVILDKIVVVVLLFISIMMVVTSTYNPFIYFRF
jgi:alginate O-acetyltransferase complex protein AlgI